MESSLIISSEQNFFEMSTYLRNDTDVQEFPEGNLEPAFSLTP